MSDLSGYLAQNYLVADPKPTKKSKNKKNKDDTSGLLITEDDDYSWAKTNKQNDDDEAEMTGVLSGASSQFRKAKKSNWKNLTKPSQTTDAADAILASVAAENAANQKYDDELPAVDAATSDPSVAMMADGTHAGLQSAAAISAQLKKRQREEREEFERIHKGAKEAETIYRDATGRRIDISMRREAARKVAREREEKEAEAKKALKGEVQIQQERRRQEELEDAALMKFSRNADDEDLNRELKEKQRWNDPLAQFLIPKTSGESAGHRGGKIEPVYAGSAPPNRYGIKPGYRWDGVDRGNGFETKRFKTINQKERNKNMEYSWQMDT